MMNNEECHGYIVVAGYGSSGSGAISDYLSGRDDIYSALQGKEFRFMADPGGINDLYYALTTGFHPNKVSDALEKFYNFALRCGRSSLSYPPGQSYSEVVPGYEDIIHKFINDVTVEKFEAMPWFMLSEKNYLQSLLIRKMRRYYKKRKIKKSFGQMRLLVEKDVFIKKIDELLADILTFGTTKNLTNEKFVMVNQGGSFWRPEESTELYKKRKVVIVDRDPRDVFADLKFQGYGYPGNNVELFCRWYKNMMTYRDMNIEKWENTIFVRFEDFVKEEEKTLSKFFSFLNLEDSVTSSYDLSQSAKNIGIYKSFLSKKEANFIIKELGATLTK